MKRITINISKDYIYAALFVGTGALLMGLIWGTNDLPLWKYALLVYLTPLLLLIICTIEIK